MNKYESNKVNSFKASTEVMSTNETIWKDSSRISSVFQVIKDKITLIGLNDQKQIPRKKVSSVIKKELRDQSIALAVKISVSAVDYAAGSKNPALEFSVRLIKGQLIKLKGNTLLTVLSNFNEKVLPFKDQLTHLEPSDMDDFGKLLDQLRKAMPQTQAEIDQSKTANQNVALLIMEINELFYELDKYIAPYQYKNPDFYSDYRNSRVVKDLKRKSRMKKQETKAA